MTIQRFHTCTIVLFQSKARLSTDCRHYALNEERLQNWNTWLHLMPITVDKLPSYDVDVAANPMTSFEALPVNSRFNFMLDNAQNTIFGVHKRACMS